MSVNKRAESGVPDISSHRELAPHEEDALEAGKRRWLPRLFQSYGTPIPDLMASPLKTGLIFGLPAGIVGAGLGSAIGGAVTNKPGSGMGALIGGLGAGGLAAIAAGMDREAKNEGLEELMRRMPEGASKRDLLADPQYQSDFLGWDNNKIVATARARYYRPTERFSKRTADMADARSRYNDRHKSSSSHKDISMSQSEKQAMSPSTQILLNYLLRTGIVGGAVGGAAGAVTSKNKLRGMARGMLMGAGTGLGVGAGIPAGAGVGGGVYMGLGGNPMSYQGMQNLGNAATLGAGTLGTLGGIGGYTGGKALADKLVGPAEDEDGDVKVKPENKKAAQAILNNKTLTLAEKMAAYKTLLLKQADEPIPLPNMPVEEPVLPALKPAPLPGPQSTAGQRVVTPPAGMGGESLLPSAAPKLPLTGVDPASMLVTSGGSAPAGLPRSAPSQPTSNQPGTLEVLKQLVGVGNRRSTLYDETAKRLGQLNQARLGAGKALGENVLYPAAKGLYHAPGTAMDFAKYVGGKGRDAVNSGTMAGKAFAKWLKPDAPPPPGLLEQLKPYAPYAAVGGAGLGALALADYLSRGKKKKRRPEPRQDEEYDMPKAASVNWYKLARERQKWAMSPAIAKPIVAAGPNILARLASMGRTVADSRVGQGVSSAAKYVGDRAANLPPWALPAAGTTAGVGGIYGLSKLLGGKDPSMLQQIMQSKYTPYAAAGLGTAGLLGGAAYMGSRAGKNDAKKKKKPEAENKQANLALGAGAGAGLGGLAGGLYGALAPGYEQDPDSGRRRRRSRLMGALRGLAGGAAAGGLAGGAVGHFAGPNIEKILGDFLAKKQQAGDAADKGLRTDVTMQADPVEAAKAEAMKRPPETQMPYTPDATMAGSLPGAPPQNIPNMQIPPGPAPQPTPISTDATMAGTLAPPSPATAQSMPYTPNATMAAPRM